MDTIAIDVGSEYVGLCKWDGRLLRTEKRRSESPLEAWPEWIERLGPVPPYQLLYRCTHPVYNSAHSPMSVERLAKKHGAQWFRSLSNEPAVDPALAAARFVADRHRLGIIGIVEIGACHATLAVQDPRGGILAFDRPHIEANSVAVLPQIVDSLNRMLTSVSNRPEVAARELPLICFGDRGPSMANGIGTACRLRNILIPDRADVFTTIGMLLADIVLHFRGAFRQDSLNLPRLRRALGRLMDDAATAITMEGYDLDNAVCERIAEMAYAGEQQSIEIHCDDLADESRLLSRFEEQHTAEHGSRQATGPVETRAIRVRATIETIKPDLPIGSLHPAT